MRYPQYYMDDVWKASARNLFNVISLFAGGGGSSTGYRLAGGQVLAVNEFVANARKTYRANYPNTPILTDDIRNITPSDLKQYIPETGLDILDGSPPCASFSVAGAKDAMWGQVKKYSDTKQRTDDLFYEFARILEGLQPKVFICENVKGLTQGTSKKLLGSAQMDLFGEHNNAFYHVLSDCGYNVDYKVLNAKFFAVPQHRERLFIIGVRADLGQLPSFPKGQSEVVTLADALDEPLSIKINRAAFGETSPRMVDFNDVCFTVTGDGLGATRRYKVTRHGTNPLQSTWAQGGVSTSDRIRASLVKSKEKPSPTILAIPRRGVGYVEDETGAITKLTIPELIRICGFPEDYVLTGSYSKQWERLGRSVPPLLMKAVAEHIYQTVLSCAPQQEIG